MSKGFKGFDGKIHEGEIICNAYTDNTPTGKKIARSKHGFREGRTPIDQKKKNFAADLILNQHKTYKEVAELIGLSKSALNRAVRDLKAKRILASEK